MFDVNPIIGTDSYKVTHWPQYPKGTQAISAYLEARGLSPYAKEMGFAPLTLSYGALAYLLQSVLGRPVTREDIEEAQEFFALHFGNPEIFNRKGWEKIVNTYGGWLPLHVRAVPEGFQVPLSNILMGVESTDEDLPWLTNYMETRLTHAWYPYTVATLAWNCRQTILKHLVATGTPEDIDFKLQDFGYRGAAGDEAAAVGGSAQQVSFKGSDNMIALKLLRDYYGIPMAGFSVPAAEHSTITTWGRSQEHEAFLNMLEAYKNYPIISVVSDSFNIYNACEHIWGEQLKDQVMHHKGTLVVRPDSGDPIAVTLKVLEILYDKFGGTVNQKGYKVLDSHVRILQGDGVNPLSMDQILENWKTHGFSADNMACFGMGGALLQGVTRDTFKFAFKASAIKINGIWRPVFKDPVDAPDKKSKSGRLTLYLDERRDSQTYNTFITDQIDLKLTGKQPGTDMMTTMYLVEKKGSFIGGFDDFDTIRTRSSFVRTTPPAQATVKTQHDGTCVLSYDNEVDLSNCTCQPVETVGYGHGV